MKRLLALAATSLCLAATTAVAQDYRQYDRPGYRAEQNERDRIARLQEERAREQDRFRDLRQERREEWREQRDDERDRIAGAHRDWQHWRWSRGDTLPMEYRAGEHIVRDWRAFRLHRPPAGFEWVRSGDRFMLVNMRTGYVAELAELR